MPRVPPRIWNGSVVLLCVAAALGAAWLALGSPDLRLGGIALKSQKFAAVLVLLVESLPSLAVTWLGAAGYGWPIRRWVLGNPPQLPTPAGPGPAPGPAPGPDAAWAIQVGTGLAVLLLLNWLAAWAGGLHAAVSWTIPGVGVAMLAGQAYAAQRANSTPNPSERRRLPGLLVLAAPGVGLLIACAAAPPGALWGVEAWGYDVKSYHLQIPREWLAAGAMVPLKHNVYGYLPGLVEATYAHLGAMRGLGSGPHSAIYTAQLFHASLAVFAAVGVGAAVRRLTTLAAGVLAGAVLLSLPWVLVTGSLAYNEMVMLALGSVALAVLLDIRSERWRGAAVIGLLVGAATLAKPTAGPMLALPIGVVLLTRLNHAVRWRRPPAFRKAVTAAAVATVVGVAVLSPYLIRNAVWTGNPVFPFATDLFGQAHWDQPVADRWQKAHGLSEAHGVTPWASYPDALARQWLFNTGYGAVGGRPTAPEARNVARFDREYGVPILWIAVLLAALLTVRQLRLRRAVGAMLLIMAMQVAFWLVGTHLQSRFLIPTLLPACVVVGLGFARLRAVCDRRVRGFPNAIAAALVVVLLTGTVGVLRAQTIRQLPLYVLVDSMATFADLPVNRLPPGSKVYVVADNTGLLYVEPAMVYHSAFDANPLGDMMRESAGPAEVAAALSHRGITHVWVGWSELRRLHATYGFDPAVTEPRLRNLAAHWHVVADFGTATLYRIGRESSHR